MPESPTTRLGLYKSKSDGSENVNLVLDLLNNWDRLDLAAGVQIVTSSTRPSSPFPGKLIAESDTGYRSFFHNGTSPTSGGWVEIPNSSSTFGKALSIGGGLSVGGTLSVAGNVSVSGNLTTSGVGQQLFVRKTGNQSSNSNSYSSDSELTLSLAAGATYIFNAFITYSTVAAAGINMRFSYSGTFSSAFWNPGAISGSSGTTANTAGLRADGNNVNTGFALFGGNGALFLVAQPIGVLNTTTAGNLFFEWSQNATNATATTVGTNSWVLARRVG